MLFVTIPNITPSQNTPVLPNIRRIVTWPSGASSSRRNSAKLSLATILPSSVLAHRSWPPQHSAAGAPSEQSGLGSGVVTFVASSFIGAQGHLTRIWTLRGDHANQDSYPCRDRGSAAEE